MRLSALALAVASRLGDRTVEASALLGSFRNPFIEGGISWKVSD